ncbi:unnamed protein product [Adineta steineri]|uniref:Uncharacterized protein n=1 Tax=Adineta steineri TaxID=433720 RepID=A0A820FCP2_9BILA|nr:unnamed protein product [Adineta steineri]CAF1497358.1 unnamed protein product [Adineta steineri]CAF3577372.1 unnamed protein product [Adineta steineri]CAF4258753.1 unnamed protein product [Adineta steineri]
MPAPVIKIAVVGPLASGKSSFINFATETRESLTESYIPTVPVRIIEYEVPSSTRGKSQNYNVQIYDCSGDSKFEHTWAAMSYKLNGTVFVYNPEDKKQAEELNLWYNNFVEKPNLTEKCCLLVASKKDQDEEGGGGGKRGHEAKLSTLFSDIPRITFNGKADEIEAIKQTFGDFLRKVISETSRGHEQDERFT